MPTETNVTGSTIRGGRLLVTAPHRQPAHIAPHRPWGTVHARRDGLTQTLCGLPTTTWFVFWTESFNPSRPTSCEDCARALPGF